eukprot:2786298-Rhodomonas_salina.3
MQHPQQKTTVIGTTMARIDVNVEASSFSESSMFSGSAGGGVVVATIGATLEVAKGEVATETAGTRSGA